MGGLWLVWGRGASILCRRVWPSSATPRRIWNLAPGSWPRRFQGKCCLTSSVCCSGGSTKVTQKAGICFGSCLVLARFWRFWLCFSRRARPTSATPRRCRGFKKIVFQQFVQPIFDFCKLLWALFFGGCRLEHGQGMGVFFQQFSQRAHWFALAGSALAWFLFDVNNYGIEMELPYLVLRSLFKFFVLGLRIFSKFPKFQISPKSQNLPKSKFCLSHILRVLGGRPRRGARAAGEVLAGFAALRRRGHRRGARHFLDQTRIVDFASWWSRVFLDCLLCSCFWPSCRILPRGNIGRPWRIFGWFCSLYCRLCSCSAARTPRFLIFNFVFSSFVFVKLKKTFSQKSNKSFKKLFWKFVGFRYIWPLLVFPQNVRSTFHGLSRFRRFSFFFKYIINKRFLKTILMLSNYLNFTFSRFF